MIKTSFLFITLSILYINNAIASDAVAYAEKIEILEFLLQQKADRDAETRRLSEFMCEMNKCPTDDTLFLHVNNVLGAKLASLVVEYASIVDDLAQAKIEYDKLGDDIPSPEERLLVWDTAKLHEARKFRDPLAARTKWDHKIKKKELKTHVLARDELHRQKGDMLLKVVHDAIRVDGLAKIIVEYAPNACDRTQAIIDYVKFVYPPLPKELDSVELWDAAKINEVCRFRDPGIEGVDWGYLDLSNTDFSGARRDGFAEYGAAEFENPCVLLNANFSDAQLSSHCFTRPVLSHNTKFIRADLRNSRFGNPDTTSKLCKADFTDANMFNVHLTNADFGWENYENACSTAFMKLDDASKFLLMQSKEKFLRKKRVKQLAEESKRACPEVSEETKFDPEQPLLSNQTRLVRSAGLSRAIRTQQTTGRTSNTQKTITYLKSSCCSVS